MKVTNAVYREIVPSWDDITLPLKAGTPMSESGQIANGSGAVGIVPQTVTVRPVVPVMRILVGGSVSLAEVNAAYGEELSSAAMQAMSGILFYGPDGTPEPDPLPAVSSGDAGKVLGVGDTGLWEALAVSGGFPEVFVYSGYIVKKAGVSGAENRYTRAELSALLDKYGIAWYKTRLDVESGTYMGSYFALAFIFKIDGGNASVIVIPNGLLGLGGGSITLTGTQTTKVAAPSISVSLPSSGGGSSIIVYADDLNSFTMSELITAFGSGIPVVYVTSDAMYWATSETYDAYESEYILYFGDGSLTFTGGENSHPTVGFGNGGGGMEGGF